MPKSPVVIQEALKSEPTGKMISAAQRKKSSCLTTNGNKSKLAVALESSLKLISHSDQNLAPIVASILSQYNIPSRHFHTDQHIPQVSLPETQNFILEGKPALTEAMARDLVFAAYHDLHYANDQQNPIKDLELGWNKLKNSLGVTDINQAVPYKDIQTQLNISGISHQDLSVIEKLFDLNAESTIKLSGYPAKISELLSACQLAYDARKLGINNDVILDGLIRIQMTIAFQKDHPQHLLSRALEARDILDTSISDASVLHMVNEGARFANRDVGNLLSQYPGKALEGDALMNKEKFPSRPLANEFKDFFFNGLVAEWIKNKQLAQPVLQAEFDASGKLKHNTITINDSAEIFEGRTYNQIIQQAKTNLVVSTLAKTALTRGYMSEELLSLAGGRRKSATLSPAPTLPKDLTDFIKTELEANKALPVKDQINYQKLASDNLQQGLAALKENNLVVTPVVASIASSALKSVHYFSTQDKVFEQTKSMATGETTIAPSGHIAASYLSATKVQDRPQTLKKTRSWVSLRFHQAPKETPGINAF